jgi:hypothetical protein
METNEDREAEVLNPFLASFILKIVSVCFCIV